jgi:hypothetical protein
MAIEPLALLCSDIHLTLKAPRARAVEPSWLDAQGAILDQLKALKTKLKVPTVVYAGDIFDKWYTPTQELVNWAISKLPVGYSIPGQHDLPNHRIEDVHRSAYWTMVEAGILYHIDKPTPVVGDLVLHGFPWLSEIKFTDTPGRTHLAVAHKYVWMSGSGYVGAPMDARTECLQEALQGFQAAVFGDNHRPFTCKIGDCHLINPGCLIQRKVDEKSTEATVGFLYRDEEGVCQLKPYRLDTSETKWVPQVEMARDDESISEDLNVFLAKLKTLESKPFDFVETVNRYMETHSVSATVKEILIDALEG